MKRIYRTEFHAAHVIVEHPKCGRLHGHTYGVEVSVDFSESVWFDFADLKEIVDKVIDTICDHRPLGIVGTEQYTYNPTVKNPVTVLIELELKTITAEDIARGLEIAINGELRKGILRNESFTVTVEVSETSHFGVRT